MENVTKKRIKGQNKVDRHVCLLRESSAPDDSCITSVKVNLMILFNKSGNPTPTVTRQLVISTHLSPLPIVTDVSQLAACWEVSFIKAHCGLGWSGRKTLVLIWPFLKGSYGNEPWISHTNSLFLLPISFLWQSINNVTYWKCILIALSINKFNTTDCICYTFKDVLAWISNQNVSTTINKV